MFVRFFAGQAFSQLGNFVFIVALPWQVILLGGSLTDLGLILTIYSGFQVVFLLLGGIVVDRFPRRTIVVVSDSLQGVLVGAMGVLVYLNLLAMWHMYVIGGLFGLASAFELPALSAFLPETVPAEKVQSANSLYQGTRTLTGVAGPALGAFIITVSGTSSAFMFDMVTFVVSAFLLAAVRTLPSVFTNKREPRGSPLTDVREGFQYVRKVSWLWITILVFTVVNAAEAGPRNVVLPIFVGVDLNGGATGIGLVLSAQAIGLFFGYVAPSLIPKIRRRGFVAYVMTTLMGVSTLLLYFASAVWQIIGLFVIRGIVVAIFSLIWETSLMQLVDEKMRGRVFSLDMFGSFALLPASMAVSGILAAMIGAREVFLLGGVVIIMCGVFGLLYGPANRFEGSAS